MVPFTFAYGMVGMVYLNSYSSEYQTLPRSVMALIVFGYLKPSDLKNEAQKSHNGFMNIYQISYLVLAATIIVNFLITIINDTHGKTKSVNRDDDILQFLSDKKKEKSLKLKKRNVQRTRERAVLMVTSNSKHKLENSTAADQLWSDTLAIG